jgi:hypothetical protein
MDGAERVSDCIAHPATPTQVRHPLTQGHSEDSWWDCCEKSSSQVDEHTSATDSPPLGNDSGSPTIDEVQDLNQQPVEDILCNKLALYSSSEESEEDMGSSQSKEAAASPAVVDSPGNESPQDEAKWAALLPQHQDPTPSTSSKAAAASDAHHRVQEEVVVKDSEEMSMWNSHEISSVSSDCCVIFFCLPCTFFIIFHMHALITVHSHLKFAYNHLTHLWAL